MALDKKSEQTKRLLTDSLKRQMEQKPLNKISIREICDGCGVNRQTFYYHFADLYDPVTLQLLCRGLIPGICQV